MLHILLDLLMSKYAVRVSRGEQITCDFLLVMCRNLPVLHHLRNLTNHLRIKSFNCHRFAMIAIYVPVCQ